MVAVVSFLLLLSVVTFYAGAANSLLSRFAGTCTQGDAERLFGIVISAVLYVLALATMRASTKERTVVILIVPILPILVWQAWFSIQLSFGILALGRSACDVLEGPPAGFPMSGSEVFYSVAWPLTSCGVLLGLVALWFGRSAFTRVRL